MNNLRKLRKNKNLTVRELGELTNISYSTISAMENGVRGFTQGNLEILCRFFNVSADYLLGNTNDTFIKVKTQTPSSPKDQLQGIKLALYDQVEDLTDDQAQQVLDIIKIIKKEN